MSNSGRAKENAIRGIGSVRRQGLQFLFSFVLAFFLTWSVSVLEAANEVVARVGDTEITEADLREALSLYMPEGAFHGGRDRVLTPEKKKAVLDQLVEKELFFKEASKQGYALSEEALRSALDGAARRYGSQGKLEKALGEKGLSLDEFKEKLRKDETVKLLVKKLQDSSMPSPEDLKDAYEKNKARYREPESVSISHILIAVDPGASEEVWQQKREFAEGLLRRIRAGEDFGTIARQYSEDPYRVKDGAIGYVHRGRLTPQELEDAAFALDNGGVSDVIRTIYGFHIMKAGDKKPSRPLDFEEVNEKIGKDLAKKRLAERKSSLLEELKKEYPVRIYLKESDNPDGIPTSKSGRPES